MDLRLLECFQRTYRSDRCHSAIEDSTTMMLRVDRPIASYHQPLWGPSLAEAADASH